VANPLECSIGNSANYLSTMLRTDGAPNDVLNNFNAFSIMLGSPLLNVSATVCRSGLLAWYFSSLTLKLD
jgi:hypothetical protein